MTSAQATAIMLQEIARNTHTGTKNNKNVCMNDKKRKKTKEKRKKERKNNKILTKRFSTNEDESQVKDQLLKPKVKFPP